MLHGVEVGIFTAGSALGERLEQAEPEAERDTEVRAAVQEGVGEGQSLSMEPRLKRSREDRCVENDLLSSSDASVSHRPVSKSDLNHTVDYNTYTKIFLSALG